METANNELNRRTVLRSVYCPRTHRTRRRQFTGCWLPSQCASLSVCRLRMKCDGTRAETRFRLSAKRTSPFKSAGGRQFSRLLAAEVCAISGSNAGYTVFRGSVKGTGYPLHSPVSPSLPLPCVTVCHHISAALYHRCIIWKHKQQFCSLSYCRHT